jgi:dipeptidyl aminopeptidase/acylaminoacyl peptidase
MSRAPRASDLYDLRVPTDVAVSADGARAAVSVKSVGPAKDGYRQAIWIVPTDGSGEARQLTLGVKNDVLPRWSPDGRTLAFLSDRMSVLIKGGAGDRAGIDEPPEDGATQVWLLPMDGGEARRLTDLPQDVKDIVWSPDGERLCVVSGATRAERDEDRRQPTDPPPRDMHLVDRLQYMLNGEGYIYQHPPKLWLVEVADAKALLLTRGTARDQQPAWSLDGRSVAFISNRRRDADLTWRTDVLHNPRERRTGDSDQRRTW